MQSPALSTVVFREFGGRRQRFELRIGEILELERLCQAGIGLISKRMFALEFSAQDIRETIRLGLMGGGMIESDASALVSFYVDKRPVATHLQIACDVLVACVQGLPEGNALGEEDNRPSADPATSSPSSPPPAPSV